MLQVNVTAAEMIYAQHVFDFGFTQMNMTAIMLENELRSVDQ